MRDVADDRAEKGDPEERAESKEQHSDKIERLPDAGAEIEIDISGAYLTVSIGDQLCSQEFIKHHGRRHERAINVLNGDWVDALGAVSAYFGDSGGRQRSEEKDADEHKHLARKCANEGPSQTRARFQLEEEKFHTRGE